MALRYGASDIHLEPGQQPDQLLGRLRIDGELQTLPELSSLLSSQLLPHLKLQAGLDIAVRRRPQDGYLQQRTPDGQLYDLRLSSLPTEQGGEAGVAFVGVRGPAAGFGTTWLL